MAIMRILPVSLRILNQNKIPQQKNRAYISNNIQKDIFSFGQTKDVLSINFENLKNSFNEDIEPFMLDNKDLYIKTCGIGLYLQDATENINKNQTKLYNYKLKKLVQINNPYFKNYRIYLSGADVYKNNLKNFDRIKQMSNLELYNKPEIKEKIAESEELFIPTKDLNVIKSFDEAYEKAYNELDQKLYETTLENTDKELSENIKILYDKLSAAKFYAMTTPYAESKNLQKEINSLEEKISEPQNYIEKMKKVDYLNKIADKITKEIENFNNNKDEIKNFISENESIKENIPSQNTIDNIFSGLYEKIDKIADESYESFNNVYETTFRNDLENLDREAVVSILKKQRTANQQLDKIINRIKMEYIAQQNENFRKREFESEKF